jgi:hypothetical protein
MIYDLILEGKNEFYPNLNKKKYNISLVNSKDKINFMIDFFNKFIENESNQKFIGCDFEFNRVQKTQREIALFQINLETENNGTIFVFYPPELNDEQNKVLIKLLTNDKIIKILHGGESLDIPYLFDQVLITEENINNFCENLYDTKYLCEYNHIESNSDNKKCSIYYLLVEAKIITQQKFIDLEGIEEKMGPIYLINIDIHTMSHDVFRYSLYDVLFLPDLIKTFLARSNIFTKLIPEISTIVFKYKRLEYYEINKIKTLIYSYNNNFIKLNGQFYLLNEIYNYYLLSLTNKIFKNLIQITYFKEFLEICLKYIVYKNISDTQDIYQTKTIKAKKIPTFSFHNYSNLNNLINELVKEIKSY